jgi:hypothetical protein
VHDKAREESFIDEQSLERIVLRRLLGLAEVVDDQRVDRRLARAEPVLLQQPLAVLTVLRQIQIHLTHASRRKSARSSRIRCFSSGWRNIWSSNASAISMVEDFHAGTSPSSESGNNADVKVTGPDGSIPWPKVSRFTTTT